MPRPHVLIVDDDQSTRSLLFGILDSSGYRVSTANDGLMGLEKFREDPAEVILTDLRMPRMDGHEFIRNVLKDCTDVMILVLTGYGSIEETVDLIRGGVSNVLTKPMPVDDIRFMVDKAMRELALRRRTRDLERRLQISERLAMIGKLAAGVAHELNNPLDGVMRFVKLTRDGLAEGSELREFQDASLQGIKRMSSIVKDLLTFSRNIALEAEEERLEHMLGEAGEQVRAARPERKFHLEYELAVPDAKVPRAMYQVFTNLLMNAVDASEDGGIIHITAGVRDGEIFISVKDHGPGIPPGIRDRVFEPFFTTKEVGQGTGLGLSIVSRIMERFGGGVHLDSEEGSGTTVTVFLPRTPRSPGEPRHEGLHRDEPDFHPAR